MSVISYTDLYKLSYLAEEIKFLTTQHKETTRQLLKFVLKNYVTAEEIKGFKNIEMLWTRRGSPYHLKGKGIRSSQIGIKDRMKRICLLMSLDILFLYKIRSKIYPQLEQTHKPKFRLQSVLMA